MLIRVHLRLTSELRQIRARFLGKITQVLFYLVSKVPLFSRRYSLRFINDFFLFDISPCREKSVILLHFLLSALFNNNVVLGIQGISIDGLLYALSLILKAGIRF
jgi:hypothetical protein